MNLSAPSGIMTRPFHIYCANHLVNLIIEHSCQTNPILQETAKLLNTISTTTRIYSIRTLIGQRCPAWVETRWYTLQNVISFVMRNEVPLLQNRVILPEDLLSIQKFNILYTPLFDLHALFESGATRLCDVFPAAMNAVRDLFSLAETTVFQNAWRYAVRTIIFFFVHYFFEGSQAHLFRLAYVFHPLGVDTLHHTLFRFQRRSQFPIPALTKTNEMPTTVVNKTYTPAELAKQFRVKQVRITGAVDAATTDTSDDQLVGAARSLHSDSSSTVSATVSSSSNSLLSSSSSDNPQTFFTSNGDTEACSSSSSSSSSDSSSSLSPSSIQTVPKQASDTTADATAILTIRYASSVLSNLLSKWASDDDHQEAMQEVSPSPTPHLQILNQKLIDLLQQYQEAESAVHTPEESSDTITQPAADSDQTEDPLSFLEETLEVDDYSFIAPHHSQPNQTVSNQQSYSYSTRSQTTADEEIQITRIRPPPSPILEPAYPTTSSSSSTEDRTDSNPLRTVKDPPVYVDDEMEQHYLSQLNSFLQEQWVSLLKSSFQWLLRSCLEEQHPKLREELTKLFVRHLSPPLLVDITDPTSYYWNLATMGEIETIFSILALNVVRSSCSEASCERVFSAAKRIVGDRRQSLHLSTLSVLVHAALYREY